MSTKQRIGYAQVSTEEKNLGLQRDALQQLGCHVIYEEAASGKNASRFEFKPKGPARRGDAIARSGSSRNVRESEREVMATQSAFGRSVA